MPSLTSFLCLLPHLRSSPNDLMETLSGELVEVMCFRDTAWLSHHRKQNPSGGKRI